MFEIYLKEVGWLPADEAIKKVNGYGWTQGASCQYCGANYRNNECPECEGTGGGWLPEIFGTNLQYGKDWTYRYVQSKRTKDEGFI